MDVLLVGIFGLIIGSFANVVIDRVPRGVSLRGRSQCDRCRRPLRWWELIPIVSAIALRFRCPTCAGVITARYAYVELATAVLALAVVWPSGGAVDAVVVLTFLGLVTLGVLAVIDADLGVVPDAISIPTTVVFALAFSVLRSPFSVLPSIAIGAGWFALQRVVSRGRWVGDGDIRVGALMGALFAARLLIVTLVASYIIGGIVAGILLVMRRAQRGDHLPFVPFLFAGALVAVVWGNRILEFYAMR